MNKTLIAASALCAAGLPYVLRRIRNPGLSILMFHGFTSRVHAGMENSSGLHLHTSAFESLCRRLASSYNVLPLPEAAEILRRGGQIPRRSVCLTFDDGYESNCLLALPILRKYSLPATVFVATDFVNNGAPLWPDRVEYALQHTTLTEFDGVIAGGEMRFPLRTLADKQSAAGRLCALLKTVPQEELHDRVTAIEQTLGAALGGSHMPDIYRPLDWIQVRAMADSGLVTIGAHTHTHRIVGRCTKEETIDEEIRTCRQLIAARAGVEPEIFAYPNGQHGDHDERTRAALVRHGFKVAVTTEPGFNPPGKSDLLALHRFGQPESPSHLDAVVSGTIDLIGRVRRGLRRHLHHRRVEHAVPTP